MSIDDAAPPVTVPRLRTERLLLREFRREDFDAYAAHVADPVAQRELSGPVDRRAAWRLFAAGTGAWMLTGAGWWIVEQHATREVVGTVGAFFRESSEELELGWSFYRAFWGRGFATEAARAALAFGLERFDRRRAIALIDPTNTPSIRVSERLGMRFETDLELQGKSVGRYVFEAPR